MLICCETCSRALHLECFRPILPAVTKSGWFCAYCVIEPPHSDDVITFKGFKSSIAKRETDVTILAVQEMERKKRRRRGFSGRRHRSEISPPSKQNQKRGMKPKSKRIDPENIIRSKRKRQTVNANHDQVNPNPNSKRKPKGMVVIQAKLTLPALKADDRVKIRTECFGKEYAGTSKVHLRKSD